MMEEQTQPTEQIVPQTEDIPVAVQKSNRSLIITFIVLSILLVAGSVFAGIQIGKNQTGVPEQMTSVPTAPTDQSRVEPTMQPSAPTVPVENWQTATVDNKVQSLQFKYPSEWQRFEDSGSVGYEDTGAGYFSLNVGFQSNMQNLSLEDFVATISSHNKTAPKIPVLVGSRKGIQINNQENGVYYSTIYCEYDPKTVLEINASGNKNIDQELLTKILSTFTFAK